MSQEERSAEKKAKAYAAIEIDCNGVTVEVRPIPAGKLMKATTFLWDIFKNIITGGTNEELIEKWGDKLFDYLNMAVTVPDIPEWTAEDLPSNAIAQVIDAFLEHTINLGNWRARVRKWQDLFGVKVETPDSGSQTLTT